jgi:hydrogenase expression/formation protein HypD
LTEKFESAAARNLAGQIRAALASVDKTVRFMEVCGTHTMAIHETGLKSLLPENLRLVSGPGCPVCVTETGFIDNAILLAKEHNAVLVTFGDLIRVPGTFGSLANHRSEGGDVRVIYSPLDSIAIAAELNPKPVVFLGVGFETTTPTIAATVKTAKQKSIDNFFVLRAFKTIHPPLKILAQKDELSGFLLPGHVSAILGSACYGYLADDFSKAGAVAGFEALDILLALRNLTEMTVSGKPAIVNDYKRVVKEHGNPAARAIVDEVFCASDATWRGLGVIPDSGLRFTTEYESFDAAARFPVDLPEAKDDPRCQCAAILTGDRTPDKCGLFGKECTPEEPVGPCMVSSEGTCAAYYKYGRI